jgi:hypothetical protein
MVATVLELDKSMSISITRFREVPATLKKEAA